MQTPWKTWTLERLPSITRTWTLRVSPARNAGMSSRAAAAANVSIALVTVVHFLAGATGHPRYGFRMLLGRRPDVERDPSPVAERTVGDTRNIERQPSSLP